MCTSKTDNPEDTRNADTRANSFFFPCTQAEPETVGLFCTSAPFIVHRTGVWLATSHCCTTAHTMHRKLPPPLFFNISWMSGKMHEQICAFSCLSHGETLSPPRFLQRGPRCCGAVALHTCTSCVAQTGTSCLRVAARYTWTTRQRAICHAKLAQKATCVRACVLVVWLIWPLCCVQHLWLCVIFTVVNCVCVCTPELQHCVSQEIMYISIRICVEKTDSVVLSDWER